MIRSLSLPVLTRFQNKAAPEAPLWFQVDELKFTSEPRLEVFRPVRLKQPATWSTRRRFFFESIGAGISLLVFHISKPGSWWLALAGSNLKEHLLNFAVISPRFPLPMLMRSTERIGVISAAVPLKKSSSETYSAAR
jgi:hypothetical protein